MFFYVSGEGHSDVGVDTEHPGLLIDALRTLAESVSDEEFNYEIVPRLNLVKMAKCMPLNRKAMLYRGKKREDAGTFVVQKEAMALAKKAQEDENAGAVFFHDCDYPNNVNGERYYRQMVRAVQSGFAMASSFRHGVPMIPKPRSESWLLCCYQKVPYMIDNYFEDVPANDTAAGSGKKLLASFFNCKVNEIYKHIHVNEIEWQRIKAPSFLFFKQRFIHVVEGLTHKPFTVPEEDTLMR